MYIIDVATKRQSRWSMIILAVLQNQLNCLEDGNAHQQEHIESVEDIEM